MSVDKQFHVIVRPTAISCHLPEVSCQANGGFTLPEFSCQLFLHSLSHNYRDLHVAILYLFACILLGVKYQFFLTHNNKTCHLPIIS